jgi:hypothetical protein
MLGANVGMLTWEGLQGDEELDVQDSREYDRDHQLIRYEMDCI